MFDESDTKLKLPYPLLMSRRGSRIVYVHTRVTADWIIKLIDLIYVSILVLSGDYHLFIIGKIRIISNWLKKIIQNNVQNNIWWRMMVLWYSRILEIASSQANWQVGRLAVNK